MAKRSSGVEELPVSDLSVEDTLGEQEEEVSAPQEDPQRTEYSEGEQAEDSPFGEWSTETASHKPFQAILYGPPGGGKTYYAATFPSPLFIDMENGLRSILKLGPVGRYPRDPEEKIVNLNQVRDAWYQIKKATAEGRFPYETIVLDSLQELQILVTNEVIGKYTQVSRQMDDQLTFQDYGKINRVFLGIIRNFLKFPYHIVMTSVETETDFEGAQTYPAFSGKGIWKDLKRVVEQIGYCTVRKNESGQLENMVSYLLHPTYIAKTRVDIDERWLPNNFSALLKYTITEP